MRFAIVTVFILGFAATSQANERFYIGARLGMSQYDGAADASPTSGVRAAPSSEISINGLPFESDETAWGMYGGWKIKDWLAVELGYNDLGNTGRETLVSFGGLAAFTTRGVAVDVEELYLASRFSLSLAAKWNANWTVGLTQTAFDTEGTLPFLFIPFPGSPISGQPISYASPDDETGFIWGFGFGWTISDRWGLDIGYRQHDTQVFDVDTFAVSVLLSF